MANVSNIFNYIQGMNPRVNTISSLGSYVDSQSQQVAEMVRREVADAIINRDSLAYKIASTSSRFSEKQLWVIAYELVNNAEYAQKVEDYYNELARREEAKREASRAKLAANKENSQGVLDYVKANGRLLKDYYQFVKSNRKFAREFYSKKFTMDSANAFLA